MRAAREAGEGVGAEEPADAGVVVAGPQVGEAAVVARLAGDRVVGVGVGDRRAGWRLPQDYSCVVEKARRETPRSGPNAHPTPIPHADRDRCPQWTKDIGRLSERLSLSG